jgi:hypothetical protein
MAETRATLETLSQRLTVIEHKLAQVLDFQAKLEPHLPMLARAATLMNGPGSGWWKKRG